MYELLLEVPNEIVEVQALIGVVKRMCERDRIGQWAGSRLIGRGDCVLSSLV